MAISNVPPPQAYTKEILAEAYAWLTHQHDNIKKRATNADALISMYLRHKRTGAGEKVSVEEFKSELKNLAGMMDHFSPQDQPSANHSPAQTPPMAPKTQVTQQQTFASNRHPGQLDIDNRPAEQRVETRINQNIQMDERGAAERDHSLPPRSSLDGLDQRTHMMLYEVKMRLNLSSEHEALRMLVRLGYRQVKNLLPEDELS